MRRFDLVGQVTCDLDPHAFWKKECDPDALSALQANAGLRFWQMIAQKEGSLVPWRDRNAFDVVSKDKFKVCDE